MAWASTAATTSSKIDYIPEATNAPTLSSQLTTPGAVSTDFTVEVAATKTLPDTNSRSFVADSLNSATATLSCGWTAVDQMHADPLAKKRLRYGRPKCNNGSTSLELGIAVAGLPSGPTE